MEGGNADLLALSGNVLSGKHRSVRGRLVTVSLDLHTTSNSGDGLLAGQVGNVDESVVEGSEDVGNAEDVLTLSDLGTERDSSFLGGSNLLGATNSPG